MRKIKQLLFALIICLVGIVTIPKTLNTANVEAAKKPTISNKEITLIVSKQKKLTVKNYSKTIKWSSSNKNIATVSKTGLVTAKKPGVTTITATAGKTKLKCKVTVKYGAFSLSKKKITINKETKIMVTMQGSNPIVEYEISDPDIVSCKWDSYWNGNKIGLTITPIQNGNADIYITNSLDERLLVAEITVKLPEPVYEEPDEDYFEEQSIPIATFLSSNTDMSTRMRAMMIYNNGDSPMRIYSSNAWFYDFDYPSYNRSVCLINENIQFINYIDIPANSSEAVVFYTSKETWFDSGTTVKFEVGYKGAKYKVVTTASLGVYSILKA